MSKYKETPTLGRADNPSKEEFVVISTLEIGHRIEQIANDLTQQKISKWQTQEQATEDRMNAAEAQK